MSIRPVHAMSYTPIPGIWTGAQPSPGANAAPPTYVPDQPPDGPLSGVEPGVRPPGSFSGVRAAGHFLRGFAMQGVDMVKGAIQNPIMTAAVVGAGAAACYFLAWAPLALTIGFAGLGLFQMAKGVMAMKADRARGDDTKAEQDFETIGRGTFDVVLAVAPLAAQKWWARRGAHVGTGKAPRIRAKAPKGKIPKAKVVVPKPKAVVPKAKVVVPKPKAVVPKPAATVVNTKVPAGKAGRAHVGSAPVKTVKAPKVLPPKTVATPAKTPPAVILPSW